MSLIEVLRVMQDQRLGYKWYRIFQLRFNAETKQEQPNYVSVSEVDLPGIPDRIVNQQQQQRPAVAGQYRS
jgi:hypothetical protein